MESSGAKKGQQGAKRPPEDMELSSGQYDQIRNYTGRIGGEGNTCMHERTAYQDHDSGVYRRTIV